MFRRWCKQHDVCNKNNLSHVLMDGGSISIPFDKLHDFYTMYIHCVKNKEKIYVVEQKTPCYNFFMDVDYKDDDALDVPTIKTICRVICDKVNVLGGKDCLISVSEPKPKDGMIKTGIHLNWPGFVVNQEMALNVRKHVTNLLSRVYSSKNWEECIDISVYKGSGLRLPWSHKKSKHGTCNGIGCTECDYGKVTEGVYLPLFIYRSQEGMGPFKQSGTFDDVEPHITMDLLKMATVRTESSPEVDIPPIKQEGSFTKAQMKNELKSSPALETFIRMNMYGQKDSRITKMFRNKKTILVSTTSMYCENIGRNHGSNHVWFSVSDDGIIAQKCFCKCDTMSGRKAGFCKDFTGRKHKLPKDLTRELFSEESKKQNASSASTKSGASRSVSVQPQVD